jgi:GntR family transcriptional regulator
MLEKNYGIVVKLSKEEVSARLAGDFIAERLEIAANDPILIRKRFVYDVNGMPVEYNVGYYRADAFTYTLESER